MSVSKLFIPEISLYAGNGGGFAQRVAISNVSAPSTTIDAVSALVFVSVPCFVRAGDSPVALADGADAYLTPGIYIRLLFPRGKKLAFITLGGTGFAYITPEG